jgi:hypothetical protein
MKKLIIYCLAFIWLGACTKDSDMDKNALGIDSDSFFVLNEGGFGNGNASLCLMDARLSSQCNVYMDQTGMPLGDVLQSGAIENDDLYLVVNGSGRVVKMSLPEMEELGILEGLSSPRYFKKVSESKGYVSDLFARAIHIIDIDNMTKTGSLPFPGWSEEMEYADGELWVSNPELFAGPRREYVYVVSVGTDRIIDSVRIGRDPVALGLDSDSDLWAIAKGNPSDDDPARLVRIDRASRTVVDSMELQSAFSAKLAVDRSSNTLAFFLDKIYVMDIGTGTLSDFSFGDLGLASPYGIEFDPRHAGSLWISDAGDFSSNGKIVRIDFRTGDVLEERETGINPNGLLFVEQ